MQVFSNGGLQTGVVMIQFYDSACTHFWHKLIIYTALLGKTPPLFPLCDLLFGLGLAFIVWSWDRWSTGVYFSSKYFRDYMSLRLMSYFQGKVVWF